MAPVKVPKKAIVLEKEKANLSIPMSKKRKKRNFDSFSIYIYKVLKSLHKNPDMGITRKSMMIMNSFVNDLLERLACEAGRLVVHGKKSTMGSSEMKAAIKFLMPGELAKHAILEGSKALIKYSRSKD